MSYRVSGEALLGTILNLDFNVTTDQLIAVSAGKFRITKILVRTDSVSITTAVGGVYDAASKGGNALVAAAQTYTTLTNGAKFLLLTLASIATTELLVTAPLYFSLTTAQGAAALGKLYLYGEKYD